jgi:tRNA-uridine 2-sulfurtransferase
MATKEKTNQRVAVGLSGGIDSSVAAYLLKRQGFEVIGLTMQTWDGSVPLKPSGRPGCFGPGEEDDLKAAGEIARRLDIKHHVVSLSAEYKAEVLEYFRKEYLAGRTPNPCVRCNRQVKFGLLLERARAKGIVFDRFATGHYARVAFDEGRGRHVLMRGADAKKDQSYFLSHLSQEQLGQLIFPLGDLRKEEVRRIATDLGWTDLLDKPESQDFIECDSYDALFAPEDVKPGPIVDDQGRVVGEHSGIIHYTVGQRRGLKLGGNPQPVYVTGVSGKDNTVHVGPKEQLYGSRLLATNLNWIALPRAPALPIRASVKVRQQHPPAAALLMRVERDNQPAVEVLFDEPQLAITPGQTAVFYEGDLVLGAGTIEGCLEQKSPLE